MLGSLCTRVRRQPGHSWSRRGPVGEGTVRLLSRGVLLLGLAWLFPACAGGEESEVASNTTPKDAAADVVDAAGDAGTDAPADVKPDGEPEVCEPKTCSQLEANCGSAPDGCGGKIECGDCPAGQTCGGGGTNKCGTDECIPRSCVQVGAQCGWASDGCAEAIDCGGCAAPETCGGGGSLNECGCAPKSCAQLGASCGTVPDGCLGTKDCGVCSGGQVCGGGGPNICGVSECEPKTCAQLGAACGFVSDGCSKAIDCGNCPAPDKCGGGGLVNQCGCTPKTCAQLGANCGSLDSGCGTIDCGGCTAPETCGGAGVDGQCGCTCSLPNATTTCVAGACFIKSCNPGWGDCDGVAANGCEAGLTSDKKNCGACGTVCGDVNGAGICLSGACSFSCNAGFANCDGNAASGCETNIQTDADHCSGCGRACSNNNIANPTCVAGACTGDCDQGFRDCNNDKLVDGCETDIGTSVDHCGGCNLACSTQNVTSPQCAGGVCTGDCVSPFADCNNDKLSDGCETNLVSNVNACGSCGSNCESPMPANTGSVACNVDTCEIQACAANHYDMDQQYSTGCECADDGVANSCSSPTNLGTIGLTTLTSSTYTLVPAGDRDWFRGTFNVAVSSCSQRPRVTLMDASGLLRMVVYNTQTCPPAAGAGYSCTEGGTSAASSGFTSWDFGHSTACGEAGTIDPTPATGSYFTLPTSFMIEVYSTQSSNTCLPYQLQFTRY